MNPDFSILMSVDTASVDVLSDTIRSAVRQSFPNWELIVVEGCSPSDTVKRASKDSDAGDPRIRFIASKGNSDSAEATNDALAEARGTYVALVHQGDILTSNALEVVARAIEEHPDVDYLYSDEDTVDSEGRLRDTFRKPDWSPERLRHQMYTGHLSVMRRSAVEADGGLHAGIEGAQEHDLVLRVTEQGGRVVHLPEVLYHWRTGDSPESTAVRERPYSWDAGVRAVQTHLQRVGIAARCERGPLAGLYHVRRSMNAWPRVSIVIPTRGVVGSVWGEPRCYVVEAVRTALAKTELSDTEILVVYDEEETPRGVLDELSAVGGELLTLLPFAGAFNFSAKCNRGFLAATGEVVVLLNDDIEAASDHWLEDLVAPLLQEQDVGMTGAQLLFSDGTLQHGGHAYRGADWTHAYPRVMPRPDFDFGVLAVNREVSGVTAACAAFRRGVYEEVGGLSEALPRNYNDVDMCLKIRQRGYRILWIGSSVLYHFESKTRESGIEQWERDFLARRWGTPAKDGFAPLG